MAISSRRHPGKGQNGFTESCTEYFSENYTEDRFGDYGCMEKDSGITIPEIAKMISVRTRTIYNHVQKLKNAGLIRRIGPDKGGHWEVKK